MTKYGIDVSEWQGEIDWEVVKALGKVDFAILRAGYGRFVTQIDKQFERNYAECKRFGIPCGAYWYSYAMSEDEARREAAVCCEVLNGKQFEYPIYVDVEDKEVFSLGRDKVSAIINAFLTALEKAGYFAGLYMSADPLTNCTTDYIRKRFAIWVAHHGVVKPSYGGYYGIWQKTNCGSVAGITGNVDLDECYTDYPAAIKSAGLNGFSRPEKKTMKVTVEYDEHIYSGVLEEQ